MRRRTLLTALVLMAPLVTAAQAPVRVVAEPDGRLVLRNLPAILGDEDVKRQLTSGLTTTLALRAKVEGVKQAGGARINIRFELWDEVFEVAAVGIDGRGERQQLADLEALTTWWADLQLTVLDPGSEARLVGQTMRLTLEVVPFSQSEQDDTQRWFSRSFAASQGGGDTGRLTDSAERRRDSLEKVLGVLMATSIQRRAVSTYRWTTVITEGG